MASARAALPSGVLSWSLLLLPLAEQVSAHGSCKNYGCVGFDGAHSCQCNSLCLRNGNCCPDYMSTCAREAISPSGFFGCRSFGCGKYAEYQACQCNDLCVKYNNCCPDYQRTCFAHASDKAHGHASEKKLYPKYTGFELALVEEFHTPLNLDEDPVWTWSDGGLLEEGQARYVKEAITFEDGKMKIGVSDRFTHNTQPCSNAEAVEIPEKPLTSGEVRTKHNMFRYGRYEVSIKAPSVQPGNTTVNGNYVATMFVFRAAKYKHWREIDIEILGNDVDTLHTNVLSADDTLKWQPDIAEEQDDEVDVNLREDFHVYAFEWLPDRITWYFDGKVIREKNESANVSIPDLSGKIMMNTWVFNETALFGGEEIQNNRYPMHTEYGWFRFYSWNGESKYPCAGMGEQCLTADDQYLSSNNPCDGIPQTGTINGTPPCVATCHR